MPRYFFNVHDGRGFVDRDGTELPDIAAARQIALRYAGEIMSDQARSAAFSKSWRLEVIDETGAVVFRLDFHVTDESIARDPNPDERAIGQTVASRDASADTYPGHFSD